MNATNNSSLYIWQLRKMMDQFLEKHSFTALVFYSAVTDENELNASKQHKLPYSFIDHKSDSFTI